MHAQLDASLIRRMSASAEPAKLVRVATLVAYKLCACIVCVCVCGVYIHTYVRTYIHTNKHTDIPTYIHTHTHYTYMHMSREKDDLSKSCELSRQGVCLGARLTCACSPAEELGL